MSDNAFTYRGKKNGKKNHHHHSKQKWPKKSEDKTTSLPSFHKRKFGDFS